MFKFAFKLLLFPLRQFIFPQNHRDLTDIHQFTCSQLLLSGCLWLLLSICSQFLINFVELFKIFKILLFKNTASLRLNIRFNDRFLIHFAHTIH